MKRTLVFGLGEIPGGVERYFFNYFPGLLNYDIQCDFVSPHRQMAYESYFTEHESRVYHVPNFKKRPISYYQAIRNIMRETTYDIVYDNMLSAANILPLKIAHAQKVPRIIAHAHNDHVPTGLSRKTMHKINVRAIGRYATDYFACSTNAGKWLFPTLQPAAIQIIPNAINSTDYLFNQRKREEIRARLNLPANAFILGHVGRFHEQKNHEFIVRIYKQYISMHPNCFLILVGEGELQQQIQLRLKELGIQDNVRFVQGQTEIGPFYSAMDCFIFPSKFEGLGIAALEAQASGLPVIASTEVPEVVNVTQNVSFLPLSDTTPWIDQISHIQKSLGAVDTTFSKRIEFGKRFAFSNFDLDKSRSILTDLLAN